MEKQEAILLGIPYAALRYSAVAADLVACLADRIGVKDTKFVVMIQGDAITASFYQMFLRREEFIGDHLERQCRDCRNASPPRRP